VNVEGEDNEQITSDCHVNETVFYPRTLNFMEI